MCNRFSVHVFMHVYVCVSMLGEGTCVRVDDTHPYIITTLYLSSIAGSLEGLALSLFQCYRQGRSHVKTVPSIKVPSLLMRTMDHGHERTQIVQSIARVFAALASAF